MLRQLCWISLFASGCALDNPSQDCGNGITCPTSLACDLAHRTCVPPDDLEACAGKDDLAGCSTRMVVDGTCSEGICVAIGCGNGVWDRSYTEGCDDGNNEDGDGCSAACTVEQCGNGTLDHGEECDDGNLRSHDGCDSRCLPEQLVWTALRQVMNPKLAYAAGAYDEARQRFVMFGGVDDQDALHGETLEWDGATWRVITPQTVPDARRGAAMVYDADRHVIVMFGGKLANGTAADTWEWDGEHWIDRTSEVAPSPRQGHAMVYDPVRKRVILFGGELREVSDYASDTWSWDGTAWTELHPATAPSPRAFAAATYDPVASRVVIAGGVGRVYSYPEDTWLWDGTTWSAGPSGVGKREAGTLTFDPDAGLVLAGGGWENVGVGFEHVGVKVLREGAWASIDESDTALRHGHIAFYDARLGHVVLGSGLDGTHSPDEWWAWPPTDSMATMTLKPTSVTYGQLEAPPAPSERSYSALAYNARTGRTLMFGGATPKPNYFVLRDTWELVDGAWRPLAESGPAASTARMVYDTARNKQVLLGNWSGFNAWEWSGTEWVLAPAAKAWPITGAMAIGYDADLGETILHGCYTVTESGFVAVDGTWSWNGSRWLQRDSAPAMRATSVLPLTYDGASKQLVLFGNGTWTWSAEAGWQSHVSTIGPSARDGAALAYDPLRNETLLAGGNPTTFDLWRWANGSWQRVIAQNPPRPRAGVAMVYDAVHEQFILFGSDEAGVPNTYRLRWESQTRDDNCSLALDLDGDKLAGCADPDCAAWCAAKGAP